MYKIMFTINSVSGNMKENNDILFVLVICECTVEQSTAFRTLIAPHSEAIANTFVYDNSRLSQTTSYKVAEYVHDTANSGLSKAYNEACKFALSNGYKWMLIMDQDTEFPDNALEQYIMASTLGYDMIVPRHQVASELFLSPTPYRMKSSDLQKHAPTGEVDFKDCAPINSGILLTVESFIKVGGYEEAVWLDFSDICFIERYKKYYHSFYVMPKVTCIQAFSSLEQDKSKIYKRFCIYLECARNFPRTTIFDSLSLLITTLRPTLSRTVKERTMTYLKAYIKIYVLGHKRR